jgi:hypothetical protein
LVYKSTLIYPYETNVTHVLIHLPKIKNLFIASHNILTNYLTQNLNNHFASLLFNFNLTMTLNKK